MASIGDMTAALVISAKTSSAEAALKNFQGTVKGAIGGLQARIQTANASVDQFNSKWGGAMASAQSAGIAMTAAGGAIVGSLTIAAQKAADYGGSIFDATKRTGMQAEQLTALKFAAEQSGVSFEALQGAIAKQSRNAYAASQGSKEQAAGFAALGISVTDASGRLKDGHTLFLAAADALSKVENPTQRSALAMQIFGRSGAQLLPLLTEGSGGITAMEQRAAELGLVLSTKTVGSLDEFGDRLEAAKQSLAASGIQLGAAFLPLLAQFTEKLAQVVGVMGKWMQQHPVATKLIVGLGGVIGGLMVTIGPLLIALPSICQSFVFIKGLLAGQGLISLFGGLGSKLTILKGLFPLIATGARLAWVAITGPIGWVIAAIAAVGTAVYLVIKYWDPIKKFFSNLWSGIADTFKKAGQACWKAFIWGITLQWRVMKGAVEWVFKQLRRFLPHSDADEGPLSDLTASGSAFATTFATGMLAGLPSVARSAQAIADAAAMQLHAETGAALAVAAKKPLATPLTRAPMPMDTELPGEARAKRWAEFEKASAGVTINVEGSIYGDEHLKQSIRQGVTTALRAASYAR